MRNQDDELNYRLTGAGWRIWFDPRIRSTYHARSSFGQLFRQYRQYGYWKVFVNKKHLTVTTWRQLAPAGFLLALAGLSALALWAQFQPPVGGRPCGARAVDAAGLWLLGALGAFALSGGKWSDAPGVLRSFLTLHLAYGWGYWQGIWHFLLLRRSPSAEFKALTR